MIIMADLWLELKDEIAKKLDSDVNSIKEPEEHGDFAFACFPLAKKMGKSPDAIAADMVKEMKIELIERVEATGPYVNFYVNYTSVSFSLPETCRSRRY